MHFSVLDGWWVEGYKQGAGWALPLESVYEDNNYQNELDSATIYTTIENEIAPAYYDKNSDGVSPEWVGYIKNTIAMVAKDFTTNRMLTDYCNQYYIPQNERYHKLAADEAKLAHEIAAWKNLVSQEWNNIRVVANSELDPTYILSEADKMKVSVSLDLGRLKPEDVGVEVLFVTTDKKGQSHIQEVRTLDFVSFENGVSTFESAIVPERTGMYQVVKRVYPKNALLPHRQDFPIVKWL